MVLEVLDGNARANVKRVDGYTKTGVRRTSRHDVHGCMKQWALFFKQVCDRNVSLEDFDKLAQRQRDRYPLAGTRIAHAFLNPKTGLFRMDSRYLFRLLTAGQISIPDILAALLFDSKLRTADHDAATEPNATERKVNVMELDYRVLGELQHHIERGYEPRTSWDKGRAVVILTKWLNAAISFNATEAITYNPAYVNAYNAEGAIKFPKAFRAHVDHLLWPYMRDLLGSFLLTLLEHRWYGSSVVEMLSPTVRAQFIESMSAFISLVPQISERLANGLEFVQKQEASADVPLFGTDKDSGMDRLRLETILDLPLVDSTHSRVGLYVYINALQAGRPLTEDSTILTHLQTRYKGDMQSLTIDLMVASFDVLANAVARREWRDYLFSLKSFVVNKVPHLISMLASSFFLPLTPEFCIEEALKFVDPNVFPSLASSFNNMLGSDSVVGDVRQEFLLACALHGLILEESIPRIYGEVPMSGLPTSGRYFKDNLVAQCQNNTQRLEELVGEIENMDGNAAAIVGAVTEVIRNLCITKDTMSLKSICSSLSRRPLALDVTLQYATPISILQPICQLLNEWKYEEDQGEHQPVYEDFAGILLLLLAMFHRYDLSKADLGINNDQSFVSQLFNTGLQTKSKDDLSEDDNKRLSNWIRGLYETQGITEEVMSTCQPQDFYLLVSTLFDQSVLACSQDKIKLDTIKTGLEMLLEPWFIPSLCIALTWLANEVARPGTNKAILVQILHKLMRPSSLSGDAQGMHAAILSMVAGLLEKPLRDLQAREPSRYDIEPLLEDLKAHAHYKRNGSSSLTELHQWTHTPNGGFRQSIRNTFQSLLSWGSHLPMIVPPPNYTHRQILSAVKIIGSASTLRVLVEEVKQQTEQDNGPLALDIATEIICAPTPDDPPEAAVDPTLILPTTTHTRPPSSSKTSLRDRLKLLLEDAPKKLASDPGTAATVVRLHRRVEAIMAEAAQAQALPPDLGAQEIIQAVDSVTADAAAVEAAAAAIVPDQSLDLNVAAGLDMDAAAAAGVAMDLDLGAAGTDLGSQSVDDMLQGSGLGSADDDIFGGLEMDPDNNFNFDDLGM
ncbi:MAG: mediator complex subunit [Bathelium mastoideum]|nr:MAG: mediator complex subunit [Bathelium mastoideum]